MVRSFTDRGSVMLDSEVFGDEDTDAEAEDNSAEDADDSSKEGSTSDEKSAEGAESKVVSLEDFLKENPGAADDVAKRVQAEADKRFENQRRRDAAASRKAQQQVDAVEDANQRQELRSKVEFEELDRRSVAKEDLKKNFNEAAQQTAGFIEETIRARPELVDALGEDKINEVADAVQAKKGDVIDFMIALNDAVSEVRVGKAKTEMEKTIASEVEAALIAKGLIERTEEADEGADETLTKTTRTSAQKTWAQTQDDYIEGRMGLDEFTEKEAARQKASTTRS